MQADAKPIPGPAPLPGHRPSRRLPRHRLGHADPRLPGDVGDVRAGRLADGGLAGPVRAGGGRAPAAPPAAVAVGARRGLRTGHAAHRVAAEPEGAALAVPDRRPAGQRLGRDRAQRRSGTCATTSGSCSPRRWRSGCSGVPRCRPCSPRTPCWRRPRLGLLPALPVALREFGLYFGAWLLGFAHQAGMLRRLANRVLVPVALALAAAGAAWIVTHPGPRGYDLNDTPWATRSGRRPSSWCCSVGRRRARPGWTAAPRSAGLVTMFNRRALTVYLWHMPFVVALTPLVDVVGWSHQDPARPGDPGGAGLRAGRGGDPGSSAGWRTWPPAGRRSWSPAARRPGHRRRGRRGRAGGPVTRHGSR